MLVAFPAIAAGGGPTSVYTASCVAGGTTSASWQRAKVTQVTLEWAAPAGSGVAFDQLVVPNPSPTPPRGLVSTATPSVNGVTPASVTLSFTKKNGTVDTTTVGCA